MEQSDRKAAFQQRQYWHFTGFGAICQQSALRIVPFPAQPHPPLPEIMGEATKEPYWRDVGSIDAYCETNIDLTAVEDAKRIECTDNGVTLVAPQMLARPG